jgi:hypothetical protein
MLRTLNAHVRVAQGYHHMAITTIALGMLDAENIEYFIEERDFSPSYGSSPIASSPFFCQ